MSNSNHDPRFVTVILKRDGCQQPFDWRKVESNLCHLSWGLDIEFVNVIEVVDNLVQRLPSGVMDAETFQTFLVQTVSTFSSCHPNYSILAGRVYVCSINKRVSKRFTAWVFKQANLSRPVLTPSFVDAVTQNITTLDAAVMNHRDFDFTYHAVWSLERTYLLRSDSRADEHIQFMYMHVAIGIHGNNINNVLETYELLSTRKMSMASPVLWNSGLAKWNFLSCYIFDPYAVKPNDAISNFADLSKLWSTDGGIGIHAGEIPATHMRRLEANEAWSLFDPADVRSLTDLVGDAFVAAYETFEHDGVATASLPARMLWDIVSSALRESGTPFLMYSDNINARNNQSHLGVIKSANLCTEIVQYSSPIETAVCTLGALCLPQFIRDDNTIDYEDLHRVAKIVVRNLDLLIEKGEYPSMEAAVSAFGTRSVGIGSLGLADIFARMEIPFTSEQAQDINIRIAETIYHGALESSCELAETRSPYDAWNGSPVSKGVLQLNMWDSAKITGQYDFDALRRMIAEHGLRNSMLTAQMPTASTAHLLGHSEGIEPYTSNVVQHRVLSGSFNELSHHLVHSLRKRGLWSEQIRNDILACCGSVQTIVGILDDIKSVFRTAFELDLHVLIDMAVDRSPFIDQSQSFSLFVGQPTPPLLMNLQIHAWRAGLKTGTYYVQSKPSSEPQPYGVSPSSLRSTPSPPCSSGSSDLYATASSNSVDMDVCPCDV